MNTSHGHHIEGSAFTEIGQTNKARCGGPGLCRLCSQEAASHKTSMVVKPDHETREDKIRRYVRKHIDSRRDDNLIAVDWTKHEVHIYSFAEVLGNWEAQVFSDLADQRLYRVFYDVETAQTTIYEYLLAIRKGVSDD